MCLYCSQKLITMNTKYYGFNIEESLFNDFEEYRQQLSQEEKRRISKTELITELIKDRLKAEFWSLKDQ